MLCFNQCTFALTGYSVQSVCWQQRYIFSDFDKILFRRIYHFFSEYSYTGTQEIYFIVSSVYNTAVFEVSVSGSS